MTEDDYVSVSDLTKVRMARTILESVLVDKGSEFRQIRIGLAKLEDRLFSQIGVLDATEQR